MQSSQQIEFIIRPDGTVEEKVVGVQGPECEDITRSIEEALGTVFGRKRLASYFNEAESQTDDSVTTSS